MKLLLTGGLGFIGSHTAVAMAQKGLQVVLFDNLVNSDPSVVDRLEKILGFRPIFEKGDIRDLDRVLDVLKRHQIDTVVHFAGLKAVGESVVKPIEYFDNNVSGTVTLLRAMEKSGVRRIIFSSSKKKYNKLI